MTIIHQADDDRAAITRRSFLKVGASGTVLLGMAGLSASLSGCSGAVQAEQGYGFLREADVVLLRALMPALLAGSLPADAAERSDRLDATLLRFDATCLRLEPPAQRVLQQLFDLLNGSLTRRLTTGITTPWSEVSEADAEAFLQRWRTSSVSLFNAGYKGLVKLVSVSHFGLPDTWKQAGYPGPLAVMYQAVNS